LKVTTDGKYLIDVIYQQIFIYDLISRIPPPLFPLTFSFPDPQIQTPFGNHISLPAPLKQKFGDRRLRWQDNPSVQLPPLRQTYPETALANSFPLAFLADHEFGF
jgi:Leucine-rich repeat (LRR) protein